MPTYKSPDDAEDDLTRLLLEAVPENELGNKTITHLASCLGLARAAVYKWVAQQKMPPERVLQVVKLSGVLKYDEKGRPVYDIDQKGLVRERVKREDFDRFVYKVG